MDENTETSIKITGFLSVSKKEFEAEEPKTMTFVLRNDSDRDIKFLTWYTPFEGVVNGHDTPVESACFSVKRNASEEVEYDGKLKKREEMPPEEAYMSLKAGNTVSVDFDLNLAYQVSLEGTYSVSFTGMSGTSEGNIEFKFDGEGFEAPNKLVHKQKIEVPPVNFAVKKNMENKTNGALTALRPTEGDIARSKFYDEFLNESPEENRLAEVEDRVPESIEDVNRDPLKPLVFNASPFEYSKVIAAHFGCFAALEITLRDSDNTLKQYGLWFGTNLIDPARASLVKKNFTTMLNAMYNTKFKYFVKKDCEKNVIAYTFKRSDKIYLCDLFWNLPVNLTDSQIGTIIHEISHAAAETDDFAYGQQACLQLALSSPDKAVMNASNYEYSLGQ